MRLKSPGLFFFGIALLAAGTIGGGGSIVALAWSAFDHSSYPDTEFFIAGGFISGIVSVLVALLVGLSSEGTAA